MSSVFKTCKVLIGKRKLGGGGLVAKSCLALSTPMDYDPPGFSVCGIFQVRILEWVAIFSSRGSSLPEN